MFEIQEKRYFGWIPYFTQDFFQLDTVEQAEELIETIHQYGPRKVVLRVAKIEDHWLEY